ncbi:MAG: hypothetical protein ACTHN0_11435 [Aquihabitans sp.]
MPKPRTVLGPGILSAALILSSCGGPNPRTATAVSTGSVGVTATAVAPSATAASSASAIRTELGGAALEDRATSPGTGA